MGRADLVARGLIRLHGEDHLEAVAEAMGSMHSAEAVQATVQVSLALASSNRPDVMTDVCTFLALRLYLTFPMNGLICLPCGSLLARYKVPSETNLTLLSLAPLFTRQVTKTFLLAG